MAVMVTSAAHNDFESKGVLFDLILFPGQAVCQHGRHEPLEFDPTYNILLYSNPAENTVQT